MALITMGVLDGLVGGNAGGRLGGTFGGVAGGTVGGTVGGIDLFAPTEMPEHAVSQTRAASITINMEW